jgi:uncharacterized membrane protein SpoIIM required for sporulation
MREGHFIKKNKERWDSYLVPTEDPDELAKRFTYLVDDLSYAKTNYPFSKTVKYINSIAAGIYLSIYRNKKESNNRFISFFSIELPLILYSYRRTLLFSFLFFLVFMLLGIFANWQNPAFVRSILGDQYVNATEERIARGDPFGVYKQEHPLLMFIMIALNNIKVSFFCFAAGLVFSVGTLYLLFNNGIMLGAFEQMFFAHGVGFKSILVVFIHGTLEISAIVIAGAAGLILGNSLIFPKTFTRLQSFTRAAKDGVKIIIGLVPIFIVAAFFEGFITRYTEMPVALSILILTSSLAFILWYYVFYPKKVFKKMAEEFAGHGNSDK